MKTHHILGILWLTLCSAVITSLFGWLRHLLSAPDFRLTPDLLLASFMFAAYLTGWIASLFLLRGEALARIPVGIIAVLSVLACIAQIITLGRLSTFAVLLGICALASLVPLLFPRRHAAA
jgi:hypothetical protein